ncbi:MAG: hypothetical protein JW882_10080 [Deltaproteobacteria bacterium]|nr:hypothetical protein [Deltaproteobacteria bacterium]
MKHFIHSDFQECYDKLPRQVKKLADKNLALLKENPQHPSLFLKKVADYWSIRIGKRHRALAVKVEDGLVWFRVGTHAEYDRQIQK